MFKLVSTTSLGYTLSDFKLCSICSSKPLPQKHFWECLLGVRVTCTIDGRVLKINTYIHIYIYTYIHIYIFIYKVVAGISISTNQKERVTQQESVSEWSCKSFDCDLFAGTVSFMEFSGSTGSLVLVRLQFRRT